MADAGFYEQHLKQNAYFETRVCEKGDFTCAPVILLHYLMDSSKVWRQEKQQKTLMTEVEAAFCSIILLLVIKVYREIITL